MAAQHPVDAVACDGLPESVEENGVIGRAVASEVKQHVDGRRPERTTAHLAALASELCVADLVGTQVQISDQKRGSFGGARAGIIKEEQQRMIAST